MSQNMLGGLPLSAVQGPRDDFEQKLASDEGEKWLEEFKLFLRKEPCWLPLLELVSKIVVPTITGKFVAKDKFKLKQDGGICSFLGDNFKNWFLSGAGQSEEFSGEQVLCCHKLGKAATDLPQKPGQAAIIPELGGEAKAETHLSEMFSLIEKQSRGQDGVLLTNGWSNIFYIRDRAGLLRAVSAYWCGDGWNVHARPVEYPRGWSAGNQVLSRNSVLESSEPVSV